ncbi:MAG: FAA hydrolase family protein [Actinomycetota bacterium]|nr:MAG: FAA hydrolase family protein [Actinomycetota bacterium]
MRGVIESFSELRGRLAEFEMSGGGQSFGSVTLSAPVLEPSKIVAAPVNYLDHMEEMHQLSHIDSLGVFLKAPSSLIGHGGTVHLPYNNRRFDQEGELCFVVGKPARNVKVEEADDYIFGYSVLLDITMRGGEDRSTRKSFDTFTPMGPWIVTADEIRSVDDLELRCWVNGVLRQDAKISELIWGVPELLAYVSSVMTLYPGDVISTGTPKGVGPIGDGDEIVAEVSQVGRLSVSVTSIGATFSVTRGGTTGPTQPSDEEFG